MTIHVSGYSLLFNNLASSGGDRHDHSILHDFTAVANDTDTIIPDPTVPLSASDIRPVKSVIATYRGDSELALIATANDIFWHIDGPPVVNVVSPIKYEPKDGGHSRANPRKSLHFQGASNTAVDAVANEVDVVATITYAQPDYIGAAHAIDFQDSNNTEGNELQSLYSLIKRGGSRFNLGVTSAGADVFVESCSWAGIAPEGSLYIDPTDMGNNLEQIPSAVGDNTANHFRFHPSVFIRKPEKLQSIATGYRDATSLIAGDAANPLRIVSVVNPITSSTWLLVIDGQWISATISHGALNIKRPRDIWNQVIVPLIIGSQATSQAVQSLNGKQLINKWQYLTYARCLPIPGTKITQTGSELG